MQEENKRVRILPIDPEARSRAKRIMVLSSMIVGGILLTFYTFAAAHQVVPKLLE